MRVRIMIGVCPLMLASLALAGGAWGASFEDVHTEMAKTPAPAGTKLQVWVPLAFSGRTSVSLTNVCVSGDSLRLKGSAESSDDMGKVVETNQYTILVLATNPIGDSTLQYYRQVSLPLCE